jgi:pimeloyl-ACP methyl ester carboxylesterase
MTENLTAAVEEFLQVGETRLHLLRGGSGRPALVLHGIEGPEGWLDFHDRVASSAEVIAPSHPGFGHSERPGWLESITSMARFYEWFLRDAGLDQVDLIGFGVGGWIAAEMATMCSHNITHLVLVDAAGIHPEKGEILDVFIRPWREVIQGGVFDAPNAAEFQRIYEAEPIADFGGSREAGRSMSMRMCYRPYMHSPSLAPLLRGVQTPTLIVWGAEDRIIPRECSELYQAAIPNSRLQLIDDCGHFPHYEKPQELAEKVLQFIRT